MSKSKKKSAKPTTAAAPKPEVKSSASKPRAQRKQSTKAERAKVLAAAAKGGLTALEVQKRFGVKPVTYYSWRKAQKRSAPRPGAAQRPKGMVAGLDVSGAVRESVRERIAWILPEIVKSEVARAFDGARRLGRRRVAAD